MSEILRPCPFCGSADIRTEPGINLNYCDKCSAEANIEHWNTRPIEDALNKRIAELEAEVTKGHELQDSYCDRIAELEAKHKVAFGLVRTLRRYCIYAHWYNPDIKDEFNEFDEEVCEYLSEYKEREG